MKLSRFATLAVAIAANLGATSVGVADPGPREHPGAEHPGAEHLGRAPNSLGEGWGLQQEEARQGVRQRRLMPLGRVIEQLRHTTPGRQLDAGLEFQGARPVYRIRWMTKDGRRVDYLIDATTGAILGGD
jgi:uncharacterized membrane protein YkoI